MIFNSDNIYRSYYDLVTMYTWCLVFYSFFKQFRNERSMKNIHFVCKKFDKIHSFHLDLHRKVFMWFACYIGRKIHVGTW